MNAFTRRRFLQGAGVLLVSQFGLGSYAFAIEPGFRLDLTSYQITPPNWPKDLVINAAVIADIHACEPLMPASRVRSIAEFTNRLRPDIIFILGDFNAGHRMVSAPVFPPQWGEALSVLRAPLGVYAILGNHDLWHGALPGMPSDGGASIRKALQHADITLLENESVRLQKNGSPFWVAGLADQLGRRISPGRFLGLDDLPGTLRQVNDDAPVILLAHEPFIFRHVPKRVAVTLCGHTHGGQVDLPILTAAYLGARWGDDYIYGHIVEDDRHMIISAGLGTSILPVRFLCPPEVVHVTIGHPAVGQTIA
ncbi:MAG: metallophosphoesterase [Methylovirgula sp.]